MEKLLMKAAPWSQLMMYVSILVLVYVLLRILYRFSRNIGYWPWYQRKATKYLRKILVIYEPIAVIIVAAEFVMVKPLFHGIIIGIIIIASVSLLRNYFSGRVLLWDGALTTGLSIISGNMNGVVSKLGRTGLRMKRNKGLQFLSYSHLLREGYMISSGEYAGAYCNLLIHRKEGESLDAISTKLYNRLVSSPYLDDRYRPELKLNTDRTALELKVLLRHKQHELELIALINEWGYSSTYNKN